MKRITLALTGALAALAFSAATGHADSVFPDYPTPLDGLYDTTAPAAATAAVHTAILDAPTPIGDEWGYPTSGNIPWWDIQDAYTQEFSVPNDPTETFEGLVHSDHTGLGCCGITNYHVSVEQDISGNVPVGEQYNYFYDDGLIEVYNNICGTPEAFFAMPFGALDGPGVPTFGVLDIPTWFVEAVGPTFFEPWASLGLY